MSARAWKRRQPERGVCNHQPPMFAPGAIHADMVIDDDGRLVTTGLAPLTDEWRAWDDSLVGVVCAWGTCVNDVCPQCGRIQGGMGRAGCPCDIHKGWRSVRPEGLPKPHPALKAKGRWHDRIRNSARSHEYAERYLKKFGWA